MSVNQRNRIRAVLERKGYRVIAVCDAKCPFSFFSISRSGYVAAIYIKLHGHIYRDERKKLLAYNIDVYVASEKAGHEIILRRLLREKKNTER